MRFISHASSSSGNLYTVESVAGKRLLIEAGCTPQKLQKALGYKLNDITGCLVTHEHADHSRSAEWLMNNGIDVYMSEGTKEALGLLHRRVHVIRDRVRFKVDGTFDVLPFHVQHDAAEPMGFIVKADGESLLFVTDTSHIKQRFACQFNTIAICCNYDAETLSERVESGDINETYAKRLLESHMEKQVTKAYIRDCCNLDKCTEIYLLHMSESNSEKEKIREEFEQEFFISTYIAGANA